MSDTKQINVRLPLELHKALDDHKVRTGEDKSDVIKRGIEAVLNYTYRAPRGAALGKQANGVKPSADTVELAAWLSGRTGMPRALCRRRINENRVTVEDEIFTGDRLEKDRLGSVSLDGKAL